MLTFSSYQHESGLDVLILAEMDVEREK